MKKTIISTILVFQFAFSQPAQAQTTDYIQMALDLLLYAAQIAINSVIEDIIDLEEDNAEALAVAKSDTAATIAAMTMAEAGVYHSTLTTHAVAEELFRNTRDYSPLSQSAFACCEEDLGVGLIKGESKQKEYQEALYEAVTTYNNSFTSTNNLYSSLKPAAENDSVDRAWSIFPLHETISSVDDSIGTIILNTNPMPAIRLEDEALETPMGKNYEVIRKIQLSKLAIPQQVMTEITSHHIPTYPLTSWYDSMRKAKGVPLGNSYAVVGNELSADAVLKMQVQKRYGNPNWGIDLHRKLQTGLLRELIAMEAVDLKFQQRLLKLDEQRLAVLAQDHANTIAERYDHQLEKYKGMTITQQKEN